MIGSGNLTVKFSLFPSFLFHSAKVDLKFFFRTFHSRSKGMPRELMNTLSLYCRWFGFIYFFWANMDKSLFKCTWYAYIYECVFFWFCHAKTKVANYRMTNVGYKKSVAMTLTEITKGGTMAQVWLSVTWLNQINKYQTHLVLTIVLQIFNVYG